jgi:hypothetical protein
VDPNSRIERRIRTIASRLRRRGAISELEFRLALGLPAEEAAPAVDSSFLAPPTRPPRPALRARYPLPSRCRKRRRGLNPRWRTRSPSPRHEGPLTLLPPVTTLLCVGPLARPPGRT